MCTLKTAYWRTETLNYWVLWHHRYQYRSREHQSEIRRVCERTAADTSMSGKQNDDISIRFCSRFVQHFLPNLYDWTAMFSSERSKIDGTVTLGSVRAITFHRRRARQMLRHPNLCLLQLEWLQMRLFNKRISYEKNSFDFLIFDILLLFESLAISLTMVVFKIPFPFMVSMLSANLLASTLFTSFLSKFLFKWFALLMRPMSFRVLIPLKSSSDRMSFRPFSMAFINFLVWSPCSPHATSMT